MKINPKKMKNYYYLLDYSICICSHTVSKRQVNTGSVLGFWDFCSDADCQVFDVSHLYKGCAVSADFKSVWPFSCIYRQILTDLQVMSGKILEENFFKMVNGLYLYNMLLLYWPMTCQHLTCHKHVHGTLMAGASLQSANWLIRNKYTHTHNWWKGAIWGSACCPRTFGHADWRSRELNQWPSFR